jgi:hypothetical protein
MEKTVLRIKEHIDRDTGYVAMIHVTDLNMTN